MARLRLAFTCFFGMLFRGRLPADAAPFLPEGGEGPGPAARALEAPPRAAALAPVPAPAPAPKRDTTRPTTDAELRTEGALALLGLLQREGRLVDFLRESLDGHDDAAIGAAARDVHRGCRKAFEDHVKVEPVMPGEEDSPITVPRGFDPGEIRLVGKTEGGPPFRGTLIHHGWRAIDARFPALADGVDRRVLAPAEVNVAG